MRKNARSRRSGHRDKKCCGLGDGAPWIAGQMEILFGARGSHSIDFYRLRDYLAAAAPVRAPKTPKAWLETQKPRFKSGEVESRHRSLVQKLLERPGAVWKPENAQAILNLRTIRANQQWSSHWKSLQD
ncbi:MAG: hypothetical protein LBF93_07030 [Zoogloeaceae bacterium]|jgi:hypothetical protein|nr:hypothetical protein [Zoogloeaceae bacterium]